MSSFDDRVDLLSDDEAKAAFEDALRARAASYAMLQRLFAKELDQDYLDQMTSMRLKASTGNDKVDRAYRLLSSFLGSRWERTLTELAVDYSKVFIGSGKSAYEAAYPFESVYLGEERRLMQEPRDEVLAEYRAAGLAKLDSFLDCEDHVAAEFEFMRVLAQRTLEGYRAGEADRAVELLEVQRRFIREHLARWLPKLSADMQKFAQSDFYRFLALYSEGFLETDSEFLDDVLEEN
ncbi:MAG: molecular chaperone TorD family protein [Eggerthellaceae bacterium]|jgi:TorA maturation chaperone TorD|nr:molecular chaperone TorD family protein [Eggerthellaceae bacterium]MDR2715400.1 molecular chaperone TorD family protein [Coriobacteriaceae bacterium]